MSLIAYVRFLSGKGSTNVQIKVGMGRAGVRVRVGVGGALDGGFPMLHVEMAILHVSFAQFPQCHMSNLRNDCLSCHCYPPFCMLHVTKPYVAFRI